MNQRLAMKKAKEVILSVCERFEALSGRKYGLFEEALWQTTDGTYIGLDHKTPLGTNGMSLEQFYASGKNSNLDGGEGGYIKDDPKMPEDPPVAEVTTTAPQPVTTTTYKTTANDTPSDATLWGDADLNGIVDVSDAVLIARYVAEDDTAVITKQGKANAAVSGMGQIVLGDAGKILKFVAKLITKEELAPK